MGRAKRSGLDGIAFTAIAAAVTLSQQGEAVAAGVAVVIGVVALLASDHVKMKELGLSEDEIAGIVEEVGLSEEDIADLSTDAVDAAEEAVDDLQSGGSGGSQ